MVYNWVVGVGVMSSVSGYILKVEPLGFAMNWILDGRERRSKNDSKGFALCPQER